MTTHVAMDNTQQPDTTASDFVLGGPKTRDGKQASRANAVKHGLTAKIVLPKILGDRSILAQCHERLRKSWNPKTPTDDFLVRELARHDTALRKAEEMEDAILRYSGRNVPSIAIPDQCQQSVDELADAALANAGASDALERITRYRRAHERGFHKTLAALRQNDSSAAETSNGSAAKIGRAFSTESECEAYLVARMGDGSFRCRSCHEKSGKWIPSRKVWQCKHCRCQNSIRTATIMARSHLSLLEWFGAIEVLLNDRDCSTSHLATVTGIKRAATVRQIARRIRTAIDSPDASRLLAGLDRVLRAG